MPLNLSALEAAYGVIPGLDGNPNTDTGTSTGIGANPGIGMAPSGSPGTGGVTGMAKGVAAALGFMTNPMGFMATQAIKAAMGNSAQPAADPAVEAAISAMAEGQNSAANAGNASEGNEGGTGAGGTDTDGTGWACGGRVGYADGGQIDAEELMAVLSMLRGARPDNYERATFGGEGFSGNLRKIRGSDHRGSTEVDSGNIGYRLGDEDAAIIAALSGNRVNDSDMSLRMLAPSIQGRVGPFGASVGRQFSQIQGMSGDWKQNRAGNNLGFDATFGDDDQSAYIGQERMSGERPLYVAGARKRLGPGELSAAFQRDPARNDTRAMTRYNMRFAEGGEVDEPQDQISFSYAPNSSSALPNSMTHWGSDTQRIPPLVPYLEDYYDRPWEERAGATRGLRDEDRTSGLERPLQALQIVNEFASPDLGMRKEVPEEYKGAFGALDAAMAPVLMLPGIKAGREAIRQGYKAARETAGRILPPALGGVTAGVVTDPGEAEGAPLPPARGNWFSVLRELVEGHPAKKPLPAEEWQKYLTPGRELNREGLKFPLRGDEVEFSNIMNKLTGQKPVAKQELLDFLEGPESRVPEFKSPRSNDYSAYVSPGRLKNYTSLLTKWVPEGSSEERAAVAEKYLESRFPMFLSQWSHPTDKTAHNAIEDYIKSPEKPSLPYDVFPEIDRKMLSQLSALRRNYQSRLKTPEFTPKAEHFDGEPNLLSHSRTTTRQTPEGEPVHFVEEIQSDWHQQARDEGGYDAPLTEREGDRYRELAPVDRHATFTPTEAAEYEQLSRKLGGFRPPKAPYSKTYAELELKKQLLAAVNNNSDYLAIAPGDEQIRRYSSALRKNVDEIGWYRDGEGKYHIEPLKEGVPVQLEKEKLEGLDERGLQNLLGREMAEKITSYAGTNRPVKIPEDVHRLVEEHLELEEKYNKNPTVRNMEPWVEKEKALEQALTEAIAPPEHYVKKSVTRWLLVRKFPEGGGSTVLGAKTPELLVKAVNKKYNSSMAGILTGDDLAVGGSGMRQFYDNVVPAEMEKLARKYGGELTETTVNGKKVKAIKITPEMREKIKKTGLPLFGAAGAAGMVGSSEE